MRRTRGQAAFLALSVILANSLFCAAAIGQPPSIEALGTFDAAAPGSQAFGVSANGNFVVGETNVPGVDKRAFRWSGVMKVLGTVGNVAGNSAAFDVSDDGLTVVGESASPAGPSRPFRLQGSTKTDLLTGPGQGSATGVSADGSVIVGEVGGRPFRFAAGTMTDLGLPSGILFAFQVTASDDCSTVVSTGFDAFTFSRALRWTAATGNVELDPAVSKSSVRGISADGTFVVGSLFETVTKPMIWSEAEGTTTIASIGLGGEIHNISANGRVAVGNARIVAGESNAIMWFDREPIELFDLLTNQGVDLSEWSSLTASAVSANGRVVVGTGSFVPLNCRMAFRAVLANQLPTVEAPQPITVECTGDGATVALAAVVDDLETNTLTVRWRVDGALRKTQFIAAGTEATFEFDFPDGESEVTVEVDDGEAVAQDGTTVTVSDTTIPVVIVAPNVKLRVDQGKIFASRTRLPLPSVTDVCDEDPVVVNNARLKLAVGPQVVRWTATDADGNVATVNQKVTVFNDPPRAKAGRDIRLRTSSKTVKARLDGSASFDKNGQGLKFSWTARGVPLVNSDRSKATGTFPIGTTTVKLTVTDPLGAKSIDNVRVIVRRAPKRNAAELAEDETARALEGANRSAAGSNRDGAASAGYQVAATAYMYGRMASATEGPLERLQLRLAQSAFSQAAGDQLLRAYLSGGGEEALEAATRSYRGSAYGAIDLGE